MVPAHLSADDYGARLDSVYNYADNFEQSAKDVCKHFNWFAFPIHLNIIDYKIHS